MTIVLRGFYYLMAAMVLFVLSAPVAVAKDYALLIANSNYSDSGWDTLKTPKSDVSELSNTLKTKYGFETNILYDATRTQIVDELEKLKRSLEDGDNLMVYYAGHGILRPGEGGYWVGVDASTKSRSGWLSFREIDQLIDYQTGMKARHILVVSDSCYSGSALRSAGTIELASTDTKTELIRRLARFRSRTAMTSGGTEPVLDGVGGSKHSIFALELLSALDSNSSIIDGRGLFLQIENDVLVRSQRVLGQAAQKPEYGSLSATGHDGGDFLFVPVGMSLPDPDSVLPSDPNQGFGLKGVSTGPGPTKIVFQNPNQTHIGDENIRSWSKKHGQCYDIQFDYGERIDTLSLRYDVFGAEATYVDFNGSIIPFESQIAKVGEKRPNYWENNRKMVIEVGAKTENRIKFRICSQLVTEPEFPGDLDDFQLRNVSLQVN